MFLQIRTIGAAGYCVIRIILLATPLAAHSQAGSGGFAAVPGQKGGQDIFGPYEIVGGWP